MKQILIAVLALFTIVSCQQKQDSKTTSKKTVKKVDSKQNSLLGPQAFKSKMDASPRKQLIDIRTHGELHQTGPIAGARVIDYNNPRFMDMMNTLNKDIPTFIYCASGGRSSSAWDKMKTAGFKEIYDLDGGIIAWKELGYPVQRHSH